MFWNSTTFFMKTVDFWQILFLFVCYNEPQSIFLSFVLFLTCEGTSFLHIKPLDELVEEQLEDGLTLFFESIFAYVPVNVEFLFFLF